MTLIKNEISVYYDKKSLILNLVIFTLIPFTIIIYDYLNKNQFNKDHTFLFVICIGFLIYYGRKYYQRKEPQIIISKIGIQLYNKNFLIWDDIKKIDIIDEKGEDAIKELRIKTKEKNYNINIIDMDIETTDLQNFIIKYHK